MTALTWVSRHDPFFWDTVQLGSKHAHFFYENGLQWLPLPSHIDSGHPPVFGYYLALIWTFLGKTLPMSHFALLPFLLLNVVLLWRMGHRLAGNAWGAWLPAIVLLDPVLLGQSVMVSPDVVVVTGFLLTLEGLTGKRKYVVLIGVLVLCSISMRGMMTAAALLTWAVVWPFLKHFDFRRLFRHAMPFVPGFVFAGWFLYWHWQATGWVGYHPGSPWAGAFKPVDTMGFFRNVATVGWRWLDFGRVGEFGILAVLLYRQLRHPASSEKRYSWLKSPLFSLLVCLLLFLLPSALLYNNLSAHRYFLPAFIGLHLFVFQWIVHSFGNNDALEPASTHVRSKTSAMLLGAVMLFMATGNLWVYPRGISMDWDSSLAHWPYHGLREDALRFLQSKDIDFAQVGTTFPNINTGESLMLNGDERMFASKNVNKNQYIMASNVFNDFSEKDYAFLAQNWLLVWSKKRQGVWIEIYKNITPSTR